MQFNPAPNKQANEVYFSRKPNTDYYIPIKLNESPVQLCESQKHLGVILDKHLNFHIERNFKICNKLIGTIKPYLFTFRENLCQQSVDALFDHTFIMMI